MIEFIAGLLWFFAIIITVGMVLTLAVLMLMLIGMILAKMWLWLERWLDQ